MKSCPFCAELIQEAAAKCRFCGEWIDPSRRPSWALSAGSNDPHRQNLPAVAHAPDPSHAPRVTATPRRSAPTHTTLMGSVPPVRPGVPSSPPTLGPGWSPPAWMAHQAPGASSFAQRPTEQTLVEALSPEQVSAALAEAAKQSGGARPQRTPYPARSPYDIGREAEPEPELPQDHSPANRQEAPPPAESKSRPSFASPDHASIEEIAERMQRIKASAAAVREAVRQEARTKTPAGDDAQDDPPPPRERRSHVHARPVDDLDEDDDLDDDPSRPGERRPRVRALARDEERDFEARPVDDLDEDDDLDDFDDFDDEHGDEAYDEDDDFSDLGPAPAPRAWLPWVGVAAVVAGIGGYVLAPYLASALTGESTPDAAEVTPAEGAPADDPSGEVRPGSVAPPPAATTDRGVEESPDGAPVASATPDDLDQGDDAPPQASKSVTAAIAQTPATDADPETQAIIDQARKLFERGGDSRLEEAQNLLERVLEAQPRLASALTLLSIVQIERGDRDGSRTTATRCTKLAPERANCWLVLGALGEESSKDTDLEDEQRTLFELSAIASYEEYIKLEPEGRFADDAQKAIGRLRR